MSSPTFAEVAVRWKDDKRPYVKKSSYAVYLQLLNHHILPAFGAGGAPDESAVQAFVLGMFSRGLSPKTVKDTLRVLQMIVDFGAQKGAWPPAGYKVRLPVLAERRTPEILSFQDEQRLLAYVRGQFSFRNLGILICLHTGLRIGEICALRWRDVDTAHGVIHVTRTIQRIYIADGDEREYSLSIDSPKTPSSIRDIPIAKDLKAVLSPLKKLVRDDDFVLTNGPQPCEPRYYRTWFQRLLQQLDIPPVRFHALRHSFATRCIESGCDYKAVSAILGHTSISTTLDLYVHPGYDEKKRAIEKMSRRLAR